MDDEVAPENFEIESEWKQVDQLLVQKNEASWILAVVEAHKIFRQVVKEVSFGETVDDQIHNAGELFKNMSALLTAHEMYQKITSEVRYKVKRAEAKKAVDALLQAVLDMVGRDFEPRGFWHRLVNSTNFFWGHHPRILAGFLAGLLIFVVLVWFLSDTLAGQWIVGLVVGFAKFVLSQTVLVVLLLAALLLAVILSFAYLERRRRE